MDIEEVITGRRSIRKFSDRVVDRELLEKIIAVSLWAPSGGNTQPWRIVMSIGKARDDIAKLIAEATNNRRNRKALEEELAGKDEIIKAITRFFENVGGAPVIALIFIPHRHVPNPRSSFDMKRWDIGRIVDFQSSAALMQNLCLTAHVYGLGTCWLTGPKWVEDQIMDYLGLKDMELVAVTPIGYPDEIPRIPKRNADPVIWLE